MSITINRVTCNKWGQELTATHALKERYKGLIGRNDNEKRYQLRKRATPVRDRFWRYSLCEFGVEQDLT